MVHLHHITTYRQLSLPENWELCSAAPGGYPTPEQLEQSAHAWLTASVPSTVSAVLHKHQQWDLAHPINVDAQDWWYRGTFTADVPAADKRIVLTFAGLATIAEVWLNGQVILTADNMFRTYEVDITEALRENNALYLHFSALDPLLAKKRPRPQWRTPLVDQQQLRWYRTTFLGRMPTWYPPIRTVGPWQAMTLEERSILSLEHISLQTSIQAEDGYVSAHLQARSLGSQLALQAELIVGDVRSPLHIQQGIDGMLDLTGDVCISAVQLWWPHTHGGQPLYAARIEIQYAEVRVGIDCGQLAFRHVELLDGTGAQFGLSVNGVPIFCRGACWTPLDMLRLTATPQAYRASLLTAQRAGMNMLRVSGTMIYESEHFYALCDELGILIWQDFMFANLDYPTSDTAFLTNCLQECEQVLARLQTHACLAILCGNSEVQQQAAMLGLTQASWQSPFFERLLPDLCSRYTDVPYWISSPSGGTLPFQANVGNAHYQGVGAFLRPLEDARRSEVRFASECLGFAHVPEDRTIDLFIKPGELAVHHPKWKARVPRDAGATWDFEDIRDYYLQLLFQLDPLKVRHEDMERYLALSRVTSGEVIASTFAEWRRPGSVCNGGLIWFNRDLWPGTGWGIIDSTGYPKAAYYYFRRVALPQACFFADEGLNGLWLHVINDRETPLAAELHIALYRNGSMRLATVTKAVTVLPRDAAEIHVDALFEQFMDLTYAYKFGPPGYAFAVATLLDQGGLPISESFYFPQGLPVGRETELGLSAEIAAQPDGTYTLTIKTERFAQAVAIHMDNLLPDDNYFHMRPNSEKVLTLAPEGKVKTVRGSISALNMYNEIPIRIS